MKRWKELCHNLGFKILFPRLFLYGAVPTLVLLGPGSIAWLAYWPPAFVKTVILMSVSLFMLNVTANLVVSRYLRLHQTDASPYEYTEDCDLFQSPYFRIHVTDRPAFRALTKSLRHEQWGRAIGLWLWLDKVLFFTALLTFVPILLLLIPFWLIQAKGRSQWPRPT